MSISKELFLSILAMDSYNRGYDAGITGLSDNSNGTVAIGGATISGNVQDFDLPGDPQGAGFYAIAYDWNGETVISYRGTNDYLSWSTANDAFSGWAVVPERSARPPLPQGARTACA